MQNFIESFQRLCYFQILHSSENGRRTIFLVHKNLPPFNTLRRDNSLSFENCEHFISLTWWFDYFPFILIFFLTIKYKMKFFNKTDSLCDTPLKILSTCPPKNHANTDSSYVSDFKKKLHGQFHFDVLKQKTPIKVSVWLALPWEAGYLATAIFWPNLPSCTDVKHHILKESKCC